MDYNGCIGLYDLTYERLKEILWDISKERDLLRHKVNVVSARTLKPEESIGNPERKDFPLVKGHEVMVEARFQGAAGQAFTDQPGDFEGSLEDVVSMPLADNFQRAVFVSTINAVLRQLGWIGETIHCRDEEPERCAGRIVRYVRDHFEDPHIAFIGLQPAMVDYLARSFPIRVTDLDPENLGRDKYGVTIEDVSKTAEVIEWGNVIFATGSTMVNNTYRSLLRDKPVVFYGVTVAGISYFTGCGKYCPLGH